MSFKWAFFLQMKNQAFEHFKTYVAFISTQFNATLQAAHSDRGGKFLLTEFTEFMESQGILHQLTAPNTPQQNGIAKRANHTIDSAACAMLQSVGMANTFWECVVTTAIHVRKCAPS